MQVMFRLPPLLGALLFVAAPFAGAESPLPDPVAPAVIGPPLDQIRPMRALRHQANAAGPKRAQEVANGRKALHERARAIAALRARPHAIEAARVHPHGIAAARARPHPVAANVSPAAVPPPAAAVAPAAAPMPQQVTTRAAIQSPAAPTQVMGNLGTARPAGPGGYFSSRDLQLVHGYYASHPASGQPAQWKLGEPIPPKSALTGVPDDIRAALSPLPAGHQYVEVDGDVVLVALPSRVVVDGISRAAR